MFHLCTLFSDHAVIQHGCPFPVWGFEAVPDSIVTVELGDCRRKTRADSLGRFKLRLPAFQPGAAPLLKVKNGEREIMVRDLVFGEVLLASGQSNMSFGIRNLNAEMQKDYTEHVGDFANVRQIIVDRVSDVRGRDDFDGRWQIAENAQSLLDWSAVATQAARTLSEHCGLVVGVVNSSIGGTPVESWLSRKALCRIDYYAALLDEFDRVMGEVADWSPEPYPIPPMEDCARNYLGASPFEEEPGFLREDAWRPCVVPVKWDALGVNGASVVAFRRRVNIPASWAGKELVCELGMMEQQDRCTFNGDTIGGTGSGYDYLCFTDKRCYAVPASAVRPGALNTILIRNFCFIWIGGVNGPAEEMRLYPRGEEQEAISLAGAWEYQVERWGRRYPYGKFLERLTSFHKDCYNVNYESMIRPIAGFPVCAAIWYQGETVSDKVEEPYAQVMTALINEWRYQWGCGDFPFIQVMLAGLQAPKDCAAVSGIAERRREQLEAADATGNTVVSALDLGDADDLHPQRKFPLGTRLGHAVWSALSGEDCGHSPRIIGLRKCGSFLELRVAHAAGLHSENGAPKTFAVGDSSGNVFPADAVIQGNVIRLRSEHVSAPVMACYAWSNNPEAANVYNGEGLPLLPYRTENWTIRAVEI